VYFLEDSLSSASKPISVDRAVRELSNEPLFDFIGAVLAEKRPSWRFDKFGSFLLRRRGEMRKESKGEGRKPDS